MISAPIFVRCMVCLAAMVAAAALAPWGAAGGELNAPEICARWPQNRLIAGSGLQSRHFMLEAKGQAQQMPPFPGAGGREIYHRTFSFSLDETKSIALYRTDAANTCVIARDMEKTLPFRVPVFFVGRAGQSAEDLKADAERTAFAPSASIAAGADFTEVSFRLRKGGRSFSDIRPFFACGLAGLMLCEGYCPGDTPVLARLLAGWTIRGVEWRPAAVQGAPAAPQEPPTQREPEANAPGTAPLRPRAAAAPPQAAPMPETAPAPRSVDRPSPPIVPPPALAKTPPIEQEAPPEPQPPVAETAPAQEEAPPVQEAPPPNVPAPAPAERRLVLVFERKSGDAISPADILKAEGSVSIEGVTLTATAEGLAAELPEAVFARWNTAQALQKLFPHYLVLGVKAEELRTIITAEPLPARKTGPILIALVSSDSDFSSQVGAEAVEGFWSGALDLAGSVSEGSWERKLLARAQSPGFSAETRMLEDSWGGRLALGSARNSILRKLIEGSSSGPAAPITGFKPLQRFQLDLALEPIKLDAGILPGNYEAKEALLLISAGIDPAGSYFSRHPVRPEESPWARPLWVKQAQRIFVLEVWSEVSAEALKRISRAGAAEGAPPGIYLCNIPGTDGANIALYGIVPRALSESARAGAFKFLTARANSYLRP